MTAIALCDRGLIIDVIWIENKNSSKLLISEIERLLQRNNLSLSQLLFLSAYQGPATFTSLRTVIATLNGIAMGIAKPLVGVNGLEVLVKEHAGNNHFAIALLNAFCNDVYYALLDHEQNTLVTGCMTSEQFIAWLKQHLGTHLFSAVGNGVLLHREKLTNAFGKQLIIPEPLPEFASLEAVVRKAYSNWQHQEIHKFLMPLYLKQHSAAAPRA